MVETPEEKLLKIIENPPAQPDRLRPAVAGPKGEAIAIQNNFNNWLKRLRINTDTSLFTLQTANRAMMGLSAIVTVFFLLDYVVFGGRINRRFDQIAQRAVMADITAKKFFVPEEKFSDIAEWARRRNIFGALPAAPLASEQPDAIPPEAAETLANLKLVGIIWSDNPQAMIEDTKENRTYLLGQGEQLGTFKIGKIFRNKVVLNKEKMEWELR